MPWRSYALHYVQSIATLTKTFFCVWGSSGRSSLVISIPIQRHEISQELIFYCLAYVNAKNTIVKRATITASSWSTCKSTWQNNDLRNSPIGSWLGGWSLLIQWSECPLVMWIMPQYHPWYCSSSSGNHSASLSDRSRIWMLYHSTSQIKPSLRYHISYIMIQGHAWQSNWSALLDKY